MPSTQEHEGARAELSSKEVINGGVTLITVSFDEKIKPADLKIHFGDTDIPYYPAPGLGGSSFQGVVGIPYTQAPGPAKITVTWKDPSARTLDVALTVKDGNYPSEGLSVDPRHVNPKKKDLIRINKEIVEISAIYRKTSREKLWNGKFLLPIQSRITSNYGTRRTFNGEMKSFHQGIDLKAAEGTPIHAPAGGTVVMAKNLFFTGNTVLLDHGFGLFTIYAHMSKLKVKKGDVVKVKQVLGLSGKTGRVSGPHLHWGAVIHKVKVNPLELTRVMQ